MGTGEGSSNGLKATENASLETVGRENWIHQPWELRQMQSLSLDSKKRMSSQRIDGWFETFGDDAVSYTHLTLPTT